MMVAYQISGRYYRAMVHHIDTFCENDLCCRKQNNYGAIPKDWVGKTYEPEHGSALKYLGPRSEHIRSNSEADRVAQADYDDAVAAYEHNCMLRYLSGLRKSNSEISELSQHIALKAAAFDTILKAVQDVGFDTESYTHADCVELITTLSTSGVDALLHKKLQMLDDALAAEKAKFAAMLESLKSDVVKLSLSCAKAQRDAQSLSETSQALSDSNWDHFKSIVRAAMAQESYSIAKNTYNDLTHFDVQDSENGALYMYKKT